MTTIAVRIDEHNDPGSGARLFTPVICVAGADWPEQSLGPYRDPERAIDAAIQRLEQVFDPTSDVIDTLGHRYVTVTEAADKLRFAYAVNTAPALPAT